MRLFFSGLLIFFILVLLAQACQSPPANGFALAKQYCGTCHLYPTPELLNRASWEAHILPRMGEMLGIYESEPIRLERQQEAAHLYPNEAILSEAEWQSIQDFYLTSAPEKLEAPKREAIPFELPQFEVVTPAMQLSPPSSTLVQFSSSGQLLLGDAHTQAFFQFDADLKLIGTAKVKEGAVHVEEKKDAFWITVMGNFSPDDTTNGLILRLPKSQQEKLSIPIKNLNRPVHSSYADLDGNGLEDIMVSEYGKWQGQISIHYQVAKGRFEQQVLLAQTGAIKTVVDDFNGDGQLDILSLFGQGKEGFYLHHNKGDRQFETASILPLSPSNGSSGFEYVDLNADGHKDILYTAGDNADFPPIVKPYHGIYGFLNDGQNNFQEHFFYPLPGAYKALVHDFDGDSDLDIAAISFFPDYDKGGRESFVYLTNQGNFTFQAATFEDNTRGRWMTMDASDYDADGDVDLVLGNLAFEAPGHEDLVERWASEALPFLILKNVVADRQQNQ